MQDLNKQDLISIHGGTIVTKAVGVAVSAASGYLGGTGMLDSYVGTEHAPYANYALPTVGSLVGTVLWTSGNRGLNSIVIGALVNGSIAAISYFGGKNPGVIEF
jgi:hypothetical protein